MAFIKQTFYFKQFTLTNIYRKNICYNNNNGIVTICDQQKYFRYIMRPTIFKLKLCRL